MKMPEVPDSVDRQALIDAFATLGLDITGALCVTIEPASMTLTYAARDEGGKKYLTAGNDLATIVVRVGTPPRLACSAGCGTVYTGPRPVPADGHAHNAAPSMTPCPGRFEVTP